MALFSFLVSRFVLLLLISALLFTGVYIGLGDATGLRVWVHAWTKRPIWICAKGLPLLHRAYIRLTTSRAHT